LGSLLGPVISDDSRFPYAKMQSAKQRRTVSTVVELHAPIRSTPPGPCGAGRRLGWSGEVWPATFAAVRFGHGHAANDMRGEIDRHDLTIIAMDDQIGSIELLDRHDRWVLAKPTRPFMNLRGR
jgi:hypothetical protein